VSHVERTVAVIVVAAGAGVRLGHDLPKAFVSLAGSTLLERAVATLGLLAEPVQVVVVAPAGSEGSALDITQRAVDTSRSPVTVVTGGATRHESVVAGLAALEPGVTTVLVHDSARCLTPVEVFDRVIADVRRTGQGVVPGVRVSDAIKVVSGDLLEGGTLMSTIDRETMLAVQTPQGFPRDALETAYAATNTVEHTDDAGVFTAAGMIVQTCPGDERSLKITTPADLARAQALILGINGDRVRVGSATDTHAFVETVGLRLAGLDWPDEFALAGHSDGDAVAHAIVDALLIAAGLGDIGGMVGVDDPQYAGASGEVFVREAVRRLAEAGYRPVNVTAQIIGNRPRLAGRRAEAEEVLSTWVGAPVTLSATTTDGLGFTGEGRGIAVVATALVTDLS
jgi:2-C-methyl-D-erythritol 4-phosphate cytidylyltransferase/2-C-methyl-D-erythritol 2,4-cyclodiphosphate synthase